jgi:hypothetical protein
MARLLALLLVCLAAPAAAFRLEDPLRDGTAGNAVGGAFGPDGWRVTDRTDRLWYALPRLVSGSVEFTVTGMSLDNLPLNDHEIFAMYEAGFGIEEPIDYNPEYRLNHYKGMLRVYGRAEEGRVGEQKLMWGMCPSGAPGYGECGCGSFFEEPFGGEGDWDGSPRRLRIEWGDGRTAYFRDGVEVVAVDWADSGLTFGPSELHMSLGTSRASAVGDAGMPVGAVFSDLVVEGVEGPPATCAGQAPPDAGVGPAPDAGAPGPGLLPTDDVTVLPGGTDPHGPDLAADGSGEESYLRFEVPGPARRALLRLHAREIPQAEGDNVAVYAVADTDWTEETLAGPPQVSAPALGATGPTEPGAWYEVDVTAAVRGGPVAFGLIGGENGAHFSSKEEAGGAFGPFLVVELAAVPPDAGPAPADAAAPTDGAPDGGAAPAGDATLPAGDATTPGGDATPPAGDGGDAEADAADGDAAGCAACDLAGGGPGALWPFALLLLARPRRRA